MVNKWECRDANMVRAPAAWLDSKAKESHLFPTDLATAHNFPWGNGGEGRNRTADLGVMNPSL